MRLFQDQIQVVLISYWRIVRSTGTYLRLAFMPLLYVSVPLIFLMVHIDRYLGYTPLSPGQTFLVKAKLATVDTTALLVRFALYQETMWTLPPELWPKILTLTVKDTQGLVTQTAVMNGTTITLTVKNAQGSTTTITQAVDSVITKVAGTSATPAEELAKLAELEARGAITHEDFVRAKSKILS